MCEKILLHFLFFSFRIVFSQSNYIGQGELDEQIRRRELLKPNAAYSGLLLRSFSGAPDFLNGSTDSVEVKKFLEYRFLPVYLSTQLDGKRPSSGGTYGMIPA